MIGKTIGSYEVVGELGGGGMGVVYRARDTVLGRQVALKFLRAQQNDGDALGRFFHEARAASALNHPNIITIFEIGESDGSSYIVMELVDGHTVRALAQAELPLEHALRIGAQTARALAVAHAAGIVHRDIKPENIMVRPDGYVKVLDFGVATAIVAGETDATATVHTNPGFVMGSLRYMSPEQGRGEALTGASDIFSLGLVLYELMTRTHPFLSPTPMGTLHSILHDSPTPPSRLNPAIPTPVESLMLSMLEKDWRRRPTAAEIVSALEQTDAFVRAVVAESAWEVSHTVGRETEGQAIGRSYAAAAAGHGSLLCVTGEAGLGKTTLVEGFLSGLQDTVIARGRCSERLAGAEAYLPVFEALSSLLRTRGGESAARIMKTAAPTWFVQVASITDEASPTGQMLSETKSAISQERMKREIVSLFEDLSRTRPAVLFLEDLHWADVSTIDLLNYLGTKCGELRLLIIVTYRPSELIAGKHPFRQVKMELEGRHLATEICLETLGRKPFEEYLNLEFPGQRFPADFIEMIYSRTEGHPLFMADLLRDLRNRGVVKGENGDWTLAQTVLHIERELPASIRSMIERKIEHISDADRHLLGVAAVEGPEFDSAVLAEILESDAGDIEDRLDALDRIHFLVRKVRETEFPDGELNTRYRFVHVLYQNVLAESLGASRRARFSLAIARSLEKHNGANAPEIASELAFLFEAGRDFKSASSYYLQASRNAGRVFAHQEVILLTERGLACVGRLPESPERAGTELSIQLLRGGALMMTRGYADNDVLATYRRAAELCQRENLGNQQWAAVRGLWAFYLVRGEYKTAIELANEAMALSKKTNDPVAAIEAHLGIGFTLSYTGDEVEAARHFESGLAIVDPRGRPDPALTFALDTGVGMRGHLATVLWYLGYPDRAVTLCDEALARAQKLRSPYNIAYTLMSNSIVSQARGDVDLTFEQAETAIAMAQEHGFRDVIGWALMRHGWCLFRLGRVEEGLAEMRFYLEQQLLAGARVSRTNAIAHYAECLLHAGRYDEALAAVEESLSTDVANGERFHEAELTRLKGELLAAGGHRREGESALRAAMSIARRNQVKGWELRAALSLSRLLRDLGQPKEAREVLAPVYEWFTEGFETADLLEAKRLLET